MVNVTRSNPVPEVMPVAPKPKPPPKAIRRPKPEPKAKPTAKARKIEPTPPPVPTPVKETAAPPQTDDPPSVQDDHPPLEDFEDAALSPPPTGEIGAVVELSIPLYDINPSPNYPNVAIRRRYEGTVLLDVFVDKTGRAAEVKVARSSGYAVLDRNARADVSRWRFKPARRGMQTVEMWIQVPVRYELKN
jgi:protein TonB